MLAQVAQARCYEAATSFWRRIKTDPDANTMGVLYWQLNDIWPVRQSVRCANCCRLPLCLSLIMRNISGAALNCGRRMQEPAPCICRSCGHATTPQRYQLA